METIIGAIISAVAAILVCIFNGNSQNKKIIAEIEKHNAVRSEQIKNLDEKVNKHNQLIERTYRLEQAFAVLENREKTTEHRVDDLEKR